MTRGGKVGILIAMGTEQKMSKNIEVGKLGRAEGCSLSRLHPTILKLKLSAVFLLLLLKQKEVG